ncbi:hypothetical protein [Streptomyces flaveus]|uniref:hypothetical protein n=1 Tax=Streptomyces flaveus TaxID=66370 RepID=UPI00332E85A2
MDTYIKMRGEGVNEEYDFLGGEPEDEWWSDFKDVVNWNGQGLCVRASAGEWSLYLTPIPSGRLDSRGRSRLFKLALDGTCGDPQVTEVALPLIGMWLEEVVGAAASARLGEAFSAAFPDDAIRRLRGRHTTEHQRERSDRFDEAVGHLGAAPYSPPGEQPDAMLELWSGVQGHGGDRQVFLDRVARLLSGSHEGVAVMGDLVYESDVMDDFARSGPLRGLRESRPDAVLTLLVRAGERPASASRPAPIPVTSSAESGVVRGKVTTAPETAEHDRSPDRQVTERFLQRMAWSCAALTMLLVAVLVLIIAATA